MIDGGTALSELTRYTLVWLAAWLAPTRVTASENRHEAGIGGLGVDRDDHRRRGDTGGKGHRLVDGREGLIRVRGACLNSTGQRPRLGREFDGKRLSAHRRARARFSAPG